MIGHLKELNSHVNVEAAHFQNLDEILSCHFDDYDLVIVTEFYPLDFIY